MSLSGWAGARFEAWLDRPARDVDSQARSQAIAILAVGGGAGLLMGMALGYLLTRWNPFLCMLVFGVPLAGLIWGMTHAMVESAGLAARRFYTPTGASTPFRGDLSQEETLIVRGLRAEAIEALTARAREDPGDPRPRLRLAELYRDEIGDLEEAAAWLRRTAAVPGLSLESERHVLRELIELCTDRIGRPELALPALGRTADRHRGNRLGIWAAREMRDIRAGAGRPRESADATRAPEAS